LTGVFQQVYGHYIVIDLKTQKSILFSPELNDFEAIWHLPRIPTKEDLKKKYGVDQVLWTKEFTQFLRNLRPEIIYKQGLL
jgi:hypothetical protein